MDVCNSEVVTTIDVAWESGEKPLEKKDTESLDDTSSTLSSLTSSDSTSDLDLLSATPAGHHPVASTNKGLAGCETSQKESELGGDFRSRPVGSSKTGIDHSKKSKPSRSQQVDFRGQLQKTAGATQQKNLPGALRKNREGPTQLDFRGQLKTTGVSTKQDLSAASRLGQTKRKEGPAQVDFRSVLANKTQSVSAFGKRLQGKSQQPIQEVKPIPPPEKQFQATSSASSRVQSKGSADTGTETKTGDKKKPERRVSSSDLFNLLYQPKDSDSHGDYLKQRGIKKEGAQKPVEQRFSVSHSTSSTGEEELKTQLAWRKGKSDHYFKPIDPKNDRQKWKQKEPPTVLLQKTRAASSKSDPSDVTDLTEKQLDSPPSIRQSESPGEGSDSQVLLLSRDEPTREVLPEGEDESCEEPGEVLCATAAEHENLVQVELNVNRMPDSHTESVEVEMILPVVQSPEEALES